MYNTSMPKKRMSEVIATQEIVDFFWLLFQCKRCGACCKVFEGVKITEEEMKRLPVPDNERQDAFERLDGAYYMKEPCRFHNASTGCSIYNERPQTCRSFPLYNERMEDGHVHLGITEMCPAAVEALVEVEVRELGR